MEKIYKYIDYRKYLSDYYGEKKRTTRHISHRYFAQKAGIKSPVFFKQIIEGKRNLTVPMIEKFSSALGLDKKEAVFFRNLVQFNQAKTAEEKREKYSVLLSMMNLVGEYRLTRDQYEYFDTWYVSVIRELVCLHDFRDDFKALAFAVRPRITAREAKRAVNLLLRLKLIKKQDDGTYRQTHAVITSGTEIASLARRNFNRTMVQIAEGALERFPVGERSVSCITLGISKPCYQVLLTELAAFKERVIAIVNQDEESSQVYQFNFQLFPLSVDTQATDYGVEQ